MHEPTWCLLTGEYPPGPGGIADYTRGLAHALAAEGAEVHVWAPRLPGTDDLAADVVVHRVDGALTPWNLRSLRSFLEVREDALLVVQYAPHALGLRAMNLPLCGWLARRSRSRPVWVMFHEVLFPWRGAPRHRLLSVVTRLMAAVVASSAHRSFVSIDAWRDEVRGLDVRRRAVTWLPVPSNVPQEAPAERVAARRREFGGQTLVGHFGTYGDWFDAQLRRAAPQLLRAGDRHLILIGRGAAAAARRIVDDSPALSGRVLAPSVEAPDQLAEVIAACDVLMQPYPDGVSTRRTTAMAALALGRPLATNDGPLTDPIWRAGDVALAPVADVLPDLVEALCRSPAEREALGRRGRELYRLRFDVRRLVETLRAAAAERVTS
jgi:glycosyltransferase involved in cell wall biosynthesis